MSRSSSALVLSLALFASCAAPIAKGAVSDGVFAIPGTDNDHHRLRYLDGQVSDNDSCMIRLGNKLNPKVPPAYVNGKPLGFC